MAKRVGRLLDPRIGRGFYITWNATSPVLKWPLDQILPGQNFTLTALRVLPEFGSDHHPYLADLCFNPAAAAWQSPPPMRPGDIEDARTAVLRGQGKADQPPPEKAISAAPAGDDASASPPRRRDTDPAGRRSIADAAVRQTSDGQPPPLARLPSSPVRRAASAPRWRANWRGTATISCSARAASSRCRLSPTNCAAIGAETTVIAADLSVPGAAAQLADELDRRGLSIDVLINNAGLGGLGRFDQIDPARVGEMLQVNIVALTELTRLLLPGMIARVHGRIMLVGSVAGFSPGPGMAVYFASKAYVLSLGEALAHELRGTGVTVTTLCPGATATDFFGVSGATHGFLARRRGRMMAADRVARIGYEALIDRPPRRDRRRDEPAGRLRRPLRAALADAACDGTFDGRLTVPGSYLRCSRKAELVGSTGSLPDVDVAGLAALP